MLITNESVLQIKISDRLIITFKDNKFYMIKKKIKIQRDLSNQLVRFFQKHQEKNLGGLRIKFIVYLF